MKNLIYIFIITIIGLTSVSCVEEIDFNLDTETFDSALVIEATITN